MIQGLERFLRKTRSFFSRSEWLVKLMGLSKSKGTSEERGLVLVQIDGLAKRYLELAMAEGRMPFLQELLEKQQYRLHSHNAGIPATTPAIQGKLMYGVDMAVPAFSFYDQRKDKVFVMFEPEDAQEIERRLKQQGEYPLLTGGSSYSNIFAGGSQEAHFCAVSIGAKGLFRNGNLMVALVLLLHVYSLLRTLGLLIMEVLIAIGDVIRGFFDKCDFGKEIKFIISRVGIIILLRELITIGAKMDVSRGLPIIHLNFVGYDEQAHRRGPDSKFALWALKGIDQSIRKVWKAAQRSTRRDYDLWVYSDHGQMRTVPYPREFNRSLEQAITEVFASETEKKKGNKKHKTGIQSQRVKFLGSSGGLGKLFSTRSLSAELEDGNNPVIVAMGPVGFIYPKIELSSDEKIQLARRLVEGAGIPMVAVPNGPDKARIWTRQGEFNLPEDAALILGENHPFLEESTKELIDLIHHENAGEFSIFGWWNQCKPYSFPVENGSHAGFGPIELEAFALITEDEPVPAPDKKYLGTGDIREMALRVLGRSEYPHIHDDIIRSKEMQSTIRVLTYNIHSCLGMDGRLSPHRIARLIAQQDPDVVALQEVDVGRMRTGGLDQGQIIARYLRMEHHFHPALHIEEERYGDAILTRFPMTLIQANSLPGPSHLRFTEPRGAVWVKIDFHGEEIHIINTHLGLRAKEKLMQVEALVGKKWLGNIDKEQHVILCGDFNSICGSTVHRRILTRLHDTQQCLDGHLPKKTWFGRYPLGRIDYIFSSKYLKVTRVEVVKSELALVASDHLPLVVDLKIIENNHQMQENKHEHFAAEES